MTCVLSITHLYQNPCSGFSEDKSELNHKKCENFDFNWIAPQHPPPGIGDSPTRCSTSCRVEASSSSGSTSRVENLTKSLSGQFKQEVIIDNILEEQGASRQKIEISTDTRTKSANINGLHADNSRRLGNIKQSVVSPYHNEPNDCRMQVGVKRKADTFDIDHVPTKRVSPFLNTPKERKDERKKVLKISLRKLRQLDDPEAFLRRTVLVNNTMKRMQTELREEKYRSRKFDRRKSFNGYNVLNNNCLSNSYLYDDPFLCGINEKITDDMTETLINNVFHDKPCDVSAVPEAVDDNKGKQSMDQCTVDANTRTHDDHVAQSERCEHLVAPDISKQCNRADNKCNQSSELAEPMQIHSSNNAVISTHCNLSEVDEIKCTNIMECDKSQPVFDIHSTGVINVDSCIENNVETHLNTDTNTTSGELNVDISDLDAITDNTYELQSVLYLDKKPDQKPMSHSFNTLMSTFDINLSSTSTLS